ncbi:MAG: hypothetical protein V7786_01900 [Sulfitobacter litoralis]|uniref:hypothetical protein n=1 Tax=Sulfitobacter litoralis TaxID=335975 RepID=UPI00300266FB
MSDNLREALEALRDKVRAGDITKAAFWKVWVPEEDGGELAYVADRAARGSIDAAKELHDAVLPSWLVHSIDQDSRKYWYVTIAHISTGGASRSKGLWSHEADASLSRAWLLSILSALISETPKGETP